MPASRERARTLLGDGTQSQGLAGRVRLQLPLRRRQHSPPGGACRGQGWAGAPPKASPLGRRDPSSPGHCLPRCPASALNEAMGIETHQTVPAASKGGAPASAKPRVGMPAERPSCEAGRVPSVKRSHSLAPPSAEPHRRHSCHLPENSASRFLLSAEG